MIELKKVSKFYYAKGMVTSGFSKVSLKFEKGEFVAITGESGSGKSTLLNVISGLDTYQEGEMLINGEETSHYTLEDYEIYRKKYIGNIFQNFNLVNSYTVYQNIELVLLINGYTKNKIKKRVLEIIKEVDLSKYKNTKVSKLSGGQKQRVAIARCLAKDTPIIIADEPTGNLDSKNAISIIKLLHKISKDKLVIIVTHNYEQVEEYVTRCITMNDGRVIKDNIIKNIENTSEEVSESKYLDTKLISMIRLGIRNTFNIKTKFILLLFVYLFVIFSLSGAYTTFKNSEYEASNVGYNMYFNTKNANKRIIVKHNDNSIINLEEIESIKNINNVDKVLTQDTFYDTSIDITKGDIFFYGNVMDTDMLEGKIDKGSMPKSDNEAIIEGYKNDYYLSLEEDNILNNEFSLLDTSINKINVKIVGIKYTDTCCDTTLYVGNSISDKLNKFAYLEKSNLTYTYGGVSTKTNIYDTFSNVIPSDKVKKGEAYVSSEVVNNCKGYDCKNSIVNVHLDNMYYSKDIDLTITNLYTKKNIEKLLGVKYEDYNGSIFINSEDYDSLLSDQVNQISVFVDNDKLVSEVITELKDKGYDTFYLKDGLEVEGISNIIKIVKLVVMVILFIILFFITYFVIKLILKSRNQYYSILRMLGSSKSVSKKILKIELYSITVVSYLVFILLIVLVNNGVIDSNTLKNLITFMGIREYTLLFITLILMSYLTSVRYARRVFKKSAITTFNEEV